MSEYRIMTGNEACVWGALAAGMNFFAGYPITPATEIAELSAELLPKRGGVYMQMEDELSSMAAVIGASVAGAKAMTATSGPGFTLMQENLGFGFVAEIPCVVLDVMRQGPCQGAPTAPAQGDLMQTRWGAHGGHPAIVLVPDSVSEAYTQVVRAFNLSEMLRTPVIVLSDATLAHMSEKVCIPEEKELGIVNRIKPSCPPQEYLPYCQQSGQVSPMAAFGDGYRWSTSGILHDDTGFPVPNSPEKISAAIHHLYQKHQDNQSLIQAYEAYRVENADVVVLAVGLVSRSAKSAVDAAREQGIRAGLFRPITLWPFPHREFDRVCAGAKAVITCEMNQGQLTEVAAGHTDRNQKRLTVAQDDGTIIRADRILAAIKEAV